MTIAQQQAEIVEEFALFDDWMAKYDYLIELGKDLPVLSAEEKTESNLIKGCQSQVWLTAEALEGKLFFRADSDAIITKGIVSLLVRTLSGHTPEEIMAADMGFLDTIGLKAHLSPTRANGLMAMVKQMKFYALAYQTKMQS
jgi:cysteine desulfuration protein SufE